MIKGINHLTLSVRCLAESLLFYRDVLGFKTLWERKQMAYLLAGDLWVCLEQDPAVREGPLPEYTHIAFTVEQADFSALAAQIRQSGARLFKENVSEGDSLYFLDPNGHKLEIHVGTWQSRLAAGGRYSA